MIREQERIILTRYIKHYVLGTVLSLDYLT